jgi:hypothetical protein
MFGIDDIIGAGLKLLDKVIPDPTEKAKAQAELMRMQHDEIMAVMGLEGEIAKSQIEVNREEAKAASLFVSGWRPSVGWVCSAAFALHFLVFPLVVFGAAVAGYTIQAPTFNMDSLMTVLMGLLGLGGLRTFEKMKGIAR